MINIDYIMDLFDWNNSITNQNLGLKLAKDVKCISVFLQPGSPYGKNVWENCAKVLAARSDNELKPHLGSLLEWLQDMNWPGAWVIFERLSDMPFSALEEEYYAAVKRAQSNNDALWLEALEDFRGRAEENG